MLPGRFALPQRPGGNQRPGDIQDVEAFSNAFLDKATRGRPLSRHDHEDCLAYIITETWRLSTRFDEARFTSFAALVRAAQPRFLIQWLRDNRVDERYGGDIPEIREWFAQPLSLDAPWGDEPDGDRLGDVVAARPGDSSPDSGPVDERLLAERRRERARDRAVILAALYRADAA